MLSQIKDRHAGRQTDTLLYVDNTIPMYPVITPRVPATAGVAMEVPDFATVAQESVGYPNARLDWTLRPCATTSTPKRPSEVGPLALNIATVSTPVPAPVSEERGREIG